jgi:putative endonuclease
MGDYIGHTDDLQRRLAEHNAPGPTWGKFTHKHAPWHMVWSESHPTRALAMAREREIKSWKSSRTIRERLLRSS